MFEDLTSLVLDIGTANSKIGYGGDDAPKVTAASYVRELGTMPIGEGPYVAGNKYLYSEQEKVEILSLFHLEKGPTYSLHFDRYENFVELLLKKELKVHLPNYSILLTQDAAAKPQEIKETRQRLAEFFFERLNVPNIYFLKSPVLSCFATGRSTAIVVDSGFSFTRAVSVHDGFCLNKSAKVVAYGGAALNREIQKVIERKIQSPIPTRYTGEGYKKSFIQFHRDQIINNIKQNFLVKPSEDGTRELTPTVEYELPDRRVIKVDIQEIKESFIEHDGETHPEYNCKGIEHAAKNQEYLYKGIPAMIADNINSCDIDIKKELYSNILLTGGGLLFGNVTQQILNAVTDIAPPNARAKSVAVCNGNDRKFTSWIGGSIVTSLASFQSYWVGAQEWKQHGMPIVNKKCI